MKREGPIVAIDGPVGVGKSEVAKALANRLNFLYIDTGAMYRAVTLKALRNGMDLNDRNAIGEMARQTIVYLASQGGALTVWCDGKDVSDDIRLPEVSAATSPIADNVDVREHLVSLQQEMGQKGKIVMEGRDIGTVVFPDAEVKIFLDADAEERARRRYRQLIEKGKQVTMEDTLRDLMERDRRDRERPVGALKTTPESIVVDTTTLTQSQVTDRLYEIVTQHPSYQAS